MSGMIIAISSKIRIKMVGLMSEQLTLLSKRLEITDRDQLYFLLCNIFSDHAYADELTDSFIEQDPHLESIKNIVDVVNILRKGIAGHFNCNSYIPPKNVQLLYEINDFETRLLKSKFTYSEEYKPRSHSIYWPNPAHKKQPSNRFTTLPYVQQHELIDATTPIGSAGSCFAIEIAHVLQEQNFNYIVTERADNQTDGVIVDGYKPGDKYAPGSFCSGIQFNTANFRHLAEKAFKVKKFQKLIIEASLPSGRQGYIDPYREDIFFNSVEAYKNNYEKHRNAIREALETCEVFILTPGLNECWKFRDGTVMARNPRSATMPYAEHRVLTVDENIENIQCFFDIVKKHNPDFKLILSVSPVPFLATGRADTHHVIEANCHSKSVLRVAIDQLVNNNKDMYYLPSYEYVSYCSKKPWQEDDRHVQRDTVEEIIEMFKAMFFKTATEQIQSIAS